MKSRSYEEEAPESIIHDGEEEASKADIPNVKGAISDARLVEDEASILAEW